MKAIRVREFGGPEVMKLEDVATPTPAANQVLVRVKAAGVNPADAYTRAGTYAIKPPLPYTPGSDGAGIVESIGAGVTKVRAGDRVYIARSVSGTYAELSVVDAARVHPLAERVSFAQGAALFVPYGTAFHALAHFAKARAGETVLVHGASGGVGLASVQFARATGCVVFGTAGTDEGLALATREGAHAVFNHRDSAYRDAIARATNGRGVDVILEMLANVNLGHDGPMLARHGRVVVIGSRGEVMINARDFMGRDASIHALSLWNASDDDEREIHAAIGAGLENGTLRPVIGKEIPLADAARAHVEIMAPGAHGKIALVP
jgi:NADPH2:quinone reductase